MTLISQQSFDLSINQTELIKKTLDYEKASLSSNTLRSYKSMWKKFETWCRFNNLDFLPASVETVALYISSLGGSVSFSTLDSTLAAIESMHEKSGESINGNASLYRRVRRGIRRTHKDNQTLKQAPPITVLGLKGVCCKIGSSLTGCRDRALITLTFFGAFRRSEVVSLNFEHLEFNEKGVIISLLQSKTSETKEIVYVAYARDQDICPILALKTWVEKAQIKEGAIFRSLIKGGRTGDRLSGHTVSSIIKKYFGQNFSGHSARRGLVTASAEKGTSIHIIKKHSRHKSADMVLRYVEAARGFEDSSVSILGV